MHMFHVFQVFLRDGSWHSDGEQTKRFCYLTWHLTHSKLSNALYFKLLMHKASMCAQPNYTCGDIPNARHVHLLGAVLSGLTY